MILSPGEAGVPRTAPEAYPKCQGRRGGLWGRQEAGLSSRPEATGQRKAPGSGEVPAQLVSSLASALTTLPPLPRQVPLNPRGGHGLVGTPSWALSLFCTEQEGGKECGVHMPVHVSV